MAASYIYFSRMFYSEKESNYNFSEIIPIMSKCIVILLQKSYQKEACCWTYICNIKMKVLFKDLTLQ